MKIFNWVHRRFNNKAENVKKNIDIEAEDHVFERWRGGILAIGTFGYDPLKEENQQLNDCFNGDDEQRDINEDDETTDYSDQEEEEVDSDDEEENPLVAYNGEESVGLTETEMEENWNHDFEYVMIKKKERTTLADLFYADSQDHGVITKKHTLNKDELLKDKSNRNRKHALSFGNKLIAKDARPIHKLNQLMRRMLKRKIHPDVLVGVGPNNSKVAPVNNKCGTTDDYASLLPTQDVNI